MRKYRFFAGAVVAALLVTAASVPRTASAADSTAVVVAIDNFSFTPQEIKVKAGTTITWTNHDDIPHTVVSTDQLFKSKALDTDDKFTTTLSKPGTYSYFCSIHPKMQGKVLVE
jgi:plastocyanin